jgi:hypothetical protein
VSGWDTAFAAINALALVWWVALIALPRWPALLSAILYFGVALLCAVYAGALVGAVSGWLPGGGEGGGFGSVAQVRALFASDAGVVIGWTHYLAFDLFVGLWIARDADAKHISRLWQVPFLVATLLAGPIGLGGWLLMRERRARRSGRWR